MRRYHVLQCKADYTKARAIYCALIEGDCEKCEFSCKENDAGFEEEMKMQAWIDELYSRVEHPIPDHFAAPVVSIMRSTNGYVAKVNGVQLKNLDALTVEYRADSTCGLYNELKITPTFNYLAYPVEDLAMPLSESVSQP